MLVTFQRMDVAKAVHINPAYVVTVIDRGDVWDEVSIIKMSNGDAFEVRGNLRQVADKLNKGMGVTAAELEGGDA